MQRRRVHQARQGESASTARSSGVGALAAPTMSCSKSLAGVDLVHLPYKIASQATSRPLRQIRRFLQPSRPLHTSRPGGAGARRAPPGKGAEQGPRCLPSWNPAFELRSEGVARLCPAGATSKATGRYSRGDDEALAAPALKQPSHTAAPPRPDHDESRSSSRRTRKWKKRGRQDAPKDE